MTVSFPPDIMSPSGKCDDGGRYATELTNDVACEAIVASNMGGLSERSFHNRTFPSREAEMTALGVGKDTARTWMAELLVNSFEHE